MYSSHESYPTERHLENGQRVYFEPKNTQNAKENLKKYTSLMAFWCHKGVDFSRTLLHVVTAYYTYDKKMVAFNFDVGTPFVFRQLLKTNHVTSDCDEVLFWVIWLRKNVIEVAILTWSRKGNGVFNIRNTYDSRKYSFQFEKCSI